MPSRLPPEMQKRIFELTLALYRVTDFFPRNEVLQRNLREKANEIFGSIIEAGYGVALPAGRQGCEADPVFIVGKIETIKGYLEIARTMRFVKPINLSVLYREYDFIQHHFLNTSKNGAGFIGDLFKRQEKVSDTKESPLKSDLPYMSDNFGNRVVGEVFPISVRHNKEKNRVRSSSNQEKTVSEIPYEYENENGSVRSPTSNTSNNDALFGNEVKVHTQLEQVKDRSTLGGEASPRSFGEAGRSSERQKAILEFLKKGEKRAKLGEFHAMFPSVSSKTIQRDLQELVSRSILRRIGEKRWTTYFLTDSSHT